MTPAQLPLTLTVEQAGRLAGISRRHAYKLVKEGAIPSVRLGAAIRIPTHRLLELLDAPAGWGQTRQPSRSAVSPDNERRRLALARALGSPRKI